LAKIVKKRGLVLPTLIDYEVRIPKGGRTDALTECSITWDTDQGELRTRGVHANQVFAAIAATVRMVNILMHRALTERKSVDAAATAA
jgi:(R)-citramalate synthase